MRQLRGPPRPGEAPGGLSIPVRRYACQRCRAILTVVPAETAPRRHYAATAIALALALYGLCRQSQAQVRAQVSPSETVCVEAEHRWCTLSRWIDAVATGALFPIVPAMPSGLGRREIAARAAMAIGAHGPPSVQQRAPEVRAFLGAAQMS